MCCWTGRSRVRPLMLRGLLLRGRRQEVGCLVCHVESQEGVCVRVLLLDESETSMGKGISKNILLRRDSDGDKLDMLLQA